MRKLWILGVIGALALLPFSALADTGGSASATLKLTHVISTVVQDNWGDMEIVQNEIAGLAGLTAVDWDTPNTITVTVYSLTTFNVYASYDDGNDKVTADGFLILKEGSASYPLKSYLVTSPTSHGMTDATAASNLTALTWTGSVNIGAGGESHTYTVQWNPSLLPSLDAGDELDLTIFFVVTEPTT